MQDDAHLLVPLDHACESTQEAQLARHTPSVTTTRASAKGSLRGFAGSLTQGSPLGARTMATTLTSLADSKIASPLVKD